MGEFQHGLFGCFDNFGVCIITWLVPCYTFGKNAEYFGDSCLMCGLGLCVPLLNIFLMTQYHGKIRERQGIDGSFIMDLILVLCCGFCVLVQDRQEVLYMSGQSISRS